MSHKHTTSSLQHSRSDVVRRGNYSYRTQCAVNCVIPTMTWSDVWTNHHRSAFFVPQFTFCISHIAIFTRTVLCVIKGNWYADYGHFNVPRPFRGRFGRGSIDWLVTVHNTYTKNDTNNIARYRHQQSWTVLAADRRSRGNRPGNARNRSAIYRNSKTIC